MSPRPITENTLFYGDNLPILREHVPDGCAVHGESFRSETVWKRSSAHSDTRQGWASTTNLWTSCYLSLTYAPLCRTI